MQRGRPRVERDPNERVPMSTRVRGELFNKLSEAAVAHDWPLGREVEARLEQSFRQDELIDPELRNLGFDMLLAFADAAKRTAKEPRGDPKLWMTRTDCYRAGMLSVFETLARRIPGGNPEPDFAVLLDAVFELMPESEGERS